MLRILCNDNNDDVDDDDYDDSVDHFILIIKFCHQCKPSKALVSMTRSIADKFWLTIRYCARLVSDTLGTRECNTFSDISHVSGLTYLRLHSRVFPRCNTYNATR